MLNRWKQEVKKRKEKKKKKDSGIMNRQMTNPNNRTPAPFSHSFSMTNDNAVLFAFVFIPDFTILFSTSSRLFFDSLFNKFLYFLAFNFFFWLLIHSLATQFFELTQQRKQTNFEVWSQVYFSTCDQVYGQQLAKRLSFHFTHNRKEPHLLTVDIMDSCMLYYILFYFTVNDFNKFNQILDILKKKSNYWIFNFSKHVIKGDGNHTYIYMSVCVCDNRLTRFNRI